CILQWLPAEVGKALIGMCNRPLKAIKFVRSAEPGSPKAIDIEPVRLKLQETFLRYFANRVKTKSLRMKKVRNLCNVLDLNQDAGSFTKDEPYGMIFGFW